MNKIIKYMVSLVAIVLLILLSYHYVFGFHESEISFEQQSDSSSDIDLGAQVTSINFEPLSVPKIEKESSKSQEFSLTNEYYQSSDLYPLATKLLELANKGDGEAQYLLNEIASECEPQRVTYIIEGLSNPPTFSENQELINWQVSRCSGFNKQNISIFLHKEKDGWLRESFKVRYPVSVIEVFSNKYKGETQQKLLEGISKEEAQQLLLTAINQKNPYALRKLRWLDKNVTSSDSWTLVSCKFGGPCEPSTINEKVSALALCSVNRKLGKYCDSSSNYNELYRVTYDEKRLDLINSRVEAILHKLESGGLGEEDLSDFLKPDK